MQTKVVVNNFLDYYKRRGFEILSSGSLLDPAIPQSFVMSVGLSQFEGVSRSQLPEGRERYALVQNCFRHFDIERVEQSNVHLSLFQMLGAFHFNSVVRETAIEQLWHLLIDIYRIDSNHLWVTYFAGDKISGCYIKADEKAVETWLKVGLPPNRIVGLGKDHNFWRQGPASVGIEASRKCGPYTEVYFDLGEDKGCSSNCRPGCQCGRFFEFASTLFISHSIYDKSEGLNELDSPFTETVVGVERLAMLLQKVDSIFRIDSLLPLIKYVCQFPKKPEKESFIESGISEQIIVDHVRAVLSLTADGAPKPGSGGRKRLMRVLIRRTLTHMQLLGISDSDFFPSLINYMAGLYEDSHPKLKHSIPTVLKYFEKESNIFERTVETGIYQIEDMIKAAHITGAQIVHLQKKRGIPLPIIKNILAQKNISYDEQEYQQAYDHWYQKEVSNAT